MPTVRKAMRGDRGAMRALYEREKGRAYAVAAFLLRDDKEAEGVVAQVFKNIWKEVMDGGIPSDAAFRAAILRKALASCKARIDRKEPAALRLGANAVYDRSEYVLPSDGDASERIRSGLPALARVYLVLRVMDGGSSMTDAEVAKLFGTTAATVAEVFSLEEEKITRACAAIPFSLPQVGELLNASAVGAVLSAEVDEKALSTVNALIAPMEAEAKKRKKTVLVSVLAAVLVVLVVASAVILPPLFDKTYYADITVKDYGTITLVLDDETAPITVRNFVELAESGFYDGLTFHRIMEGFMMQGGDPDASGTGGNLDANGKKITIKGEFSSNGVKNNISHVRGVISMARGNDPDSASSQFFIVHEDNPHLNGDYAAFGHVISGIEVVDAICEDAEPTDINGTIPKAKQPVIESVVIRTE